MVFFGAIVRSQSPFRAVAVWAKISLLIHSTVSPTLAVASAGEITRFSIVIWMVAACAETGIASVSAFTIGSIRPSVMRATLFQCRCNMFGVLLVALENLQAGLQQALQLRVVRVGNERCLQRAIDCLVIGDFVGDIGLVEFRALERADLSE